MIYLLKKYFLLISLGIVQVLLVVYIFKDAILIGLTNGFNNRIPEILFYMAIFGFLLFKKKQLIFNTFIKPSTLSGSLLIFATIVVLFIAKMGGIIFLEQLTLIILLLGIILLNLGWEQTKILFIPIIFLIVPLGVFDGLLYFVHTVLQVITANISGLLLNLFGIVTSVKGTLMYLPHITLRVDPGCSGINHITALMILALALVISKPKKILILFVSSAFLFGLILNSLRVMLIGIYAIFSKGTSLHGPGAIFYVTFIFVVGALPLIFWSTKFENVKHNIYTHKSATPLNQIKSFYAGALGLFLLTITFLIMEYGLPGPSYLKHDLNTLSGKITEYQLTEKIIKNTNYTIDGAQQTLNRAYVNSENDTILVYLSYLAKQEQGIEIVNHHNTALYSRSRLVELQPDLQLNKLRFEREGQKGSLYFTYIIDGNIYRRPIIAKLATLWTGLSKRKTNGALVVIWTSSEFKSSSSVPQKDFRFLTILIPEIQKIIYE